MEQILQTIIYPTSVTNHTLNGNKTALQFFFISFENIILSILKNNIYLAIDFMGSIIPKALFKIL